MKCFGVVLAAGLGTRLRPSTLNCPKPLIPVAGVEPLFFALFKFYQMGVRLVFVNTHHLDFRVNEKLEEWKSKFPGLELIVSFEEKILGTGGALLKIFSEHREKIKDSQMILQNGDTLGGIELNQFIDDANKNQFAISLLPEHLQKYKPLWVDPQRHWTGIGKTAPTPDSVPAHFLGIHSLSPSAIEDLLDLLSRNEIKVEETDLFNGIYRPLVTKGHSFEAVEFFKTSLPNFDFWFDMTSKEFLLEAQSFILKNLDQLSIWRQLISARFPGIQQLNPGQWVLGRLPTNFEIEAPALLVLRHPDSLEGYQGHFILGPYSTFIFEGKSLRLSSKLDVLSMGHSVFYVQSTPAAEHSIVLHNNIQGDLFVQ